MVAAMLPGKTWALIPVKRCVMNLGNVNETAAVRLARVAKRRIGC